MSTPYETAHAQLKCINSSGISLYDHLTDVIYRTITEKQTTVENIEQISHLVKQARIDVPTWKELPSVPHDEATRTRILTSLNNTSSLLQGPSHLHLYVNNPNITIPQEPLPPPNDDIDPDAPKPVLPPPTQGIIANHTVLPDLCSQSELWQQAGVNLGDETIYKLSLSINKFVETQSLASVRFFGKIMGLRADYWIIEATLSKEQLALEQTNFNKHKETWEKSHPGEYIKDEMIGTGSNQYVYFVTNSTEYTWTRLPNVLPEQILLARQMRRYLTGDLTAPVVGYPRFPYPESVLLRATIARIVASTYISPKGYFMIDEQDGEEVMIKDEEYEAVPATDLLTGDSWVHHSSYLLRKGRVQPWIKPETEDDEEEEEVKNDVEEEEDDDPIPLLTTIEKDEAPKIVPAGRELWTYRLTPRSDDPHACVSALSLVWPGAVSVAGNRTFSTIYVGNGHKALGTTKFTPIQPPRVQTEYVSEFNPEDDEVDPLVEQVDPLPPPELPEEKDEDEVTGDDDDEEEEDEEEERD